MEKLYLPQEEYEAAVAEYRSHPVAVKRVVGEDAVDLLHVCFQFLSGHVVTSLSLSVTPLYHAGGQIARGGCISAGFVV